jgi:hypothetical protein
MDASCILYGAFLSLGRGLQRKGIRTAPTGYFGMTLPFLKKPALEQGLPALGACGGS